MKLKQKLLGVSLAVSAIAVQNIYADQTFIYTGDVQTYTVPAGVTEIQIEAWGAAGGGSSGGSGGYATGTLAVTPGQELYVYVGGAGIPHPGNSNIGSGGGASDVRTVSGTWYTPASLSSRLIVAGGGGGSGYVGIGGDGGGTIGSDGAFNNDAQGGQFGLGATQVAGGGYDVGDEGDQNCLGAMEGAFGYGGDARYYGRGDTCTDTQFYEGLDPWVYRAAYGAFNGGGTYDRRGYESGGGGGGWYGGGAPGSGDFGGGGGGGSSYIGGVTAGSTTAGVRTGDGEVFISETAIATPVPLSNSAKALLVFVFGTSAFLFFRRRIANA